jgi:hypothetical protein
MKSKLVTSTLVLQLVVKLPSTISSNNETFTRLVDEACLSTNHSGVVLWVGALSKHYDSVNSRQSIR